MDITIMKNVLTLIFVSAFFSVQAQIKGRVVDEEGNPLRATLVINNSSHIIDADKNGYYTISGRPGTYAISCFFTGYHLNNKSVDYKGGIQLQNFVLSRLSMDLDEVTVQDSAPDSLGMRWLQAVLGAAIYEGKKTEFISIAEITGNLAVNSARQVFGRIPGLNIFENDGVGLQLAIGARGLDPNRTSNFNVRQNGYDISADALGYPESYYTPPVQGISQIEIVRGAAGLQYGSQFGGLLNFKMKEGPRDKVVALKIDQTIGSFGLFNSFNSLGGSFRQTRYYGFYQYKTSSGWRPNSNINQHTGFLSISQEVKPFFDIKLDLTHMHYTAQQPGGLTDAEFLADPYLSKRSRNWFQVQWNLGSLQMDYRLNPSLKVNNRFFFLKAYRYALGNLLRIDRADDLTQNRNLIKDDYSNWGNELRIMYHYDVLQRKSVMLTGIRYYQGITNSAQGDGSSASNADFQFMDPSFPDDSDYEFPSRNISVFAENIFDLSKSISITPGFRYEYISTKANGYYTDQVTNAPGEILQDNLTNEVRRDDRNILLIGLGISYKKSELMEIYSNISQNYRGINFTDIRIDNPSLQVDPNISDESGYNFDLGMRGSHKWISSFDVSLFHLAYKDRIGNSLITIPDPNFGGIIDRTITYRTNIGDSRIIGLESYVEVDLKKVFTKDKTIPNPSNEFTVFFNNAIIGSEYTSVNGFILGGVREGNKIELIPRYNVKIGLKYNIKDFRSSLLYSYMSRQFSDAANTDPATSTAIQGVIPQYSVVDLSLKYKWKNWQLGTGVNNLFNKIYFTRRASGYPGPGIIPAQPRSYYISGSFEI